MRTTVVWRLKESNPVAHFEVNGEESAGATQTTVAALGMMSCSRNGVTLT